MSTAWVIGPINRAKYRALGLTASVPKIAPDQLCLDGLEECLNHRIEAPIFVKWRFELTLGRRVGFSRQIAFPSIADHCPAGFAQHAREGPSQSLAKNRERMTAR